MRHVVAYLGGHMSGDQNKKIKYLYDVVIKKIYEDGYDGLTIRNLADLANIHHSTIYRHYKDINDILESLEYYYLAQINENLLNREEPTLTYESTLSFIQFVSKTKEYYYVLTNRHSFTNKMLDRFDDGFDVNFYQSKCNSDAKYLNIFMLLGAISIIDIWIESGCKESEEHIAKLIFNSCVAIVEMHHNALKEKEE